MATKASPRTRVRRAYVLSLLAASAFIALSAHCGSSNDSEFPEGSPCATTYKGRCGLPCNGDSSCPDGLYCAADNRCFADCLPGTTCAGGIACSPRGRCGPDDNGGGGFDGGGGGTDAIVGDSACADINVTLAKITPTIVLLVDQSGSMTEQFPPGSGQQRWNVLRDALLDPDGGVIKRLENDVSFGLTLYTWPTNQGVCPLLSNVSYAKGNYNAIAAMYADAAPIDNTPTAESIMGVVGFDDAGVLRAGGFASAVTAGPKILLLATDGDPDTCACPTCNGQAGPRNFTVWATQRAFDAGVKSYVVSIGADIDQAHQQEVANAGLGFAPNAGDAAPLFRTNNRQQLVDAINQIVLGSRSCKFTLNGSVVPGTEPQGSVTLNGSPLLYNDANGWKLNSATEIEITGSSCDAIKTSPDAQLNVRFPCGSVVPR